MFISDNEWAKKWVPLVPTVSDKLFPLVERMYERGADMLEHQLKVFQLKDQFYAEICIDDSDIEEHYQYKIEWAKYQLSHETYRRDDFEKKLQYRRHLEKTVPEKPWLTGFTRIERRIMELARQSNMEKVGRAVEYVMIEDNRGIGRYHMNRDHMTEYDKITEKYRLLNYQLWDQEVEYYAPGEYKQFEPETLKSRKALIKSLLEQHSADLGYRYDSKYSTSSLYTYTKRLSEHWLMYHATDMREMRDPRSVSDRYNIKINAGVVGADTNAKSIINAHIQPVLPLEFEWFFPIWNGATIIDYRTFNSFQELEAVVNINLTLFKIIADEIENAVLEGIREIDANN